MTALDTNVLVRFLVRDDEQQARLVYARFKQAEAARERFFVPLPVILETVWVLQSAYGKTRAQTLKALGDLRMMPIFEFEREQTLHQFLTEAPLCQVDLADLLIALAAQAAGCDTCLTFDKKATRLRFFRLLT